MTTRSTETLPAQLNDESLPARIEQVANEIAAHARTLADLRREQEILAAQHTLEIQNEVHEETGKPRYSNEDARRAALTLRLATDDQHLICTRKISDAEIERARLIAQHERLRGEFKLEWIARLEVAHRVGVTNLS